MTTHIQPPTADSADSDPAIPDATSSIPLTLGLLLKGFVQPVSQPQMHVAGTSDQCAHVVLMLCIAKQYIMSQLVLQLVHYCIDCSGYIHVREFRSLPADPRPTSSNDPKPTTEGPALYHGGEHDVQCGNTVAYSESLRAIVQLPHLFVILAEGAFGALLCSGTQCIVLPMPVLLI